MALPLPFPDPAEDFRCLQPRDPAELNGVIRETVAVRMVRIWDHSVRYVYSRIPGFGRESRASGVYWSAHPNPLFVILWAEFLPTRRFHALAGAPAPMPGQVRGGGCLNLRFSLSLHTPMPDLPKPASVRVSLYVERAQPVKSLLAIWDESRNDFARLMQAASLTACFGDLMEAQPEPYALDRYELAHSRKHCISLCREFEHINEATEVVTPILALAKIYHAIQGVIRGDTTRMMMLRS